MNRRFRLGLLFVAALPALALPAQEQKAQPDINLRTVEHLSSFAQTGRFVSDRSAAAAFFRSDHAFTELKGQLDWRHEDEAFDPAQGDGALSGMFRVESYLRLDPRSAVLPEQIIRTGHCETSAGTPRPTIACCIPTSWRTPSGAT